MPTPKFLCPAPAVGFVAVAVSFVLVACGSSAGTANGNGSSRPAGSSGSTRSTAAAHAGHASTTAARKKAVDPDAGRPLIDHVHWGATAKGPQLQVFPTHAGRTDQFPTASRRAWAEVLADSPRARTAGMYDQFLCHWNFARVVEPNKPSWDLEPWRPAVGYAATVAAACNPGGSEG